MRIRFLLGLVAAALAGLAAFAAIRALVIDIKLALGIGAPSLILPGLLAPIVLAVAAYVLSRLAYRGLFWRRYLLALQARTHLDRNA